MRTDHHETISVPAIVIAVIVWLALFMLASAYAKADETESDSSDIVGLDMASPDMAKGTPAMWFGVKSCSQYVIFLVMDDGHVWQIDEEHHPKDMEAFIKSISSLHHQLKVIPCSSSL